MSIDPDAELAQFQQFIADRREKGHCLSPEEALDLWRAENPKTEEFVDTVRALQEALAEMEAGDTGAPLDEFDRAFRRGHGLPSSA
jgi:hypothetical protein